MFLLVFIGHGTPMAGHAALFALEMLLEVRPYFIQDRLHAQAVVITLIDYRFEAVEQVKKTPVLLVQRRVTRGVSGLPGY